MNIGAQEILIIVIVVAVLFFGATRLPRLGRSMGQSVRGFKKGLQEDVPDDEGDAPAGQPPADGETDATPKT